MPWASMSPLYEGTKHTRATYLKALGADDRVLAAAMGHADPRSVRPYAQIQVDSVRGMLSQLEHRESEDV